MRTSKIAANTVMVIDGKGDKYITFHHDPIRETARLIEIRGNWNQVRLKTAWNLARAELDPSFERKGKRRAEKLAA